VLLFLLSVMALGVTLNLLFRRERQRIYLVQRELARLAFRDGLTGVHNRRSFMLAVDEHLRQATGRGHDLGHLVLVDVDDFKQINDRHGHDTGDQVLAAVAQAIERCAEPQVCGRLGGEEFGVLLSGTTDPAAFGRCLCEAVAGLGAAGLPTTVSVGIAPSGPMTRSASPSARPTRRSTAPSARARTAACWPSPPPAEQPP
jgi:diguanylate cyclase (GGDEF)-like protein